MAVREEVSPVPKPGKGKKSFTGKKGSVNGTKAGNSGQEFPKRGSKQDAGKIAPGTF
jgi:hypothetical protein